MTPLRLGVLVGIVNRAGTMMHSRVEDGTLIVTSWPPRFDPQDGSLDVQDASTYLRLAGWLHVGHSAEGLRIRAGERLNKLYQEGGETTADQPA
jgi:hypothetical protein